MSKISELTTLTSLASNDLFITVDVSDTSMAASGTDKKVTYTTLFTDIPDSIFSLADNSDPTKKVAIQLSGITTGNTRTLTVPDEDGTFALTSSKLSAFASTTSAELAGVISDETGSGSLVFATSPSLTTPSLGVASATSINKVTITAPATGSTLTIADGKTLTVSNTLTLAGTDSSTLNIGAGGTLGSAAFTNISAYEVPLTFSTGLTRTTNTITIDSTVATLTGSQILSNKTLTAPKFADLGFIADANGNELIIFDTVTSAVNEITFANAATGGNPTFTASGSDSNIGIDLTPKGTGFVQVRGNATQSGTLAIYEDTDDGSNYSAFRGSARSANIIYTLPTTDPTAGQVLTAGAPTSNVSALTWETPAAGTPTLKISTSWETAGRFFTVDSNGSQSSSFGNTGFYLQTGATSNSYIVKALPCAATTTNTNFNTMSGSPVFSGTFTLLSTGNAGSFYLGIGRSGGGYGFTNDHAGFKVVVSGGVARLYGTNGNGTESVTSALTTLSVNDFVAVRCVVNGTSSVDYYYSVNGAAWSSKTTVSSNVGTGGIYPICASIINTSAGNIDFYVHSSTYER